MLRKLIKRRDPLTKQTEKLKQNETEPRENGLTHCVPTPRSGCTNWEKMSWMAEFLNKEIRTPVVLIDFSEFAPTTSADLGKNSVLCAFVQIGHVAVI